MRPDWFAVVVDLPDSKIGTVEAIATSHCAEWGGEFDWEFSSSTAVRFEFSSQITAHVFFVSCRLTGEVEKPGWMQDHAAA